MKVYTINSVEYIGKYGELGQSVIGAYVDIEKAKSVAKAEVEHIRQATLEELVNDWYFNEEEALERINANVVEREYSDGYYYEHWVEYRDVKVVIAVEGLEVV